MGEHFRELVEKYFCRENFHQLLTGATKKHHVLSQIAVKFAKVFPSKVSHHEVMTEAKNHTSKNEAQHTKAILIAKLPNFQI